jgi:NitT/TauT family transport system permease protein
MATSTSAAAAAPVTRPQAIGWARLPTVIRRGLIAAVLVLIWHLYAVHKGPLLIATPWQTAQALWEGWREGTLAETTWQTLRLLVESVAIGAAVAAVLTAFATLSKVGEDLLILLTSLLNPLPGVAVLPLAMLLFGINETALRFVVVNATIWPIAIAVTTGFKTANATLVSVGRNIGLSRVRVITDVLVPAALPSMISGIKTAWAFAWRTIIAAELIFGVAGEESGLGNYLDNARQYFLTDQLFAGLVSIALLGVVFETLFSAVERRTIIRWGMKTS